MSLDLGGGLRIRSYAGHDLDANRLIAFLGRLSVTPGYVPGVNFGEVGWNGYRDFDPPFADCVSFCETGSGEVMAVVWLEPPNEFALTVDPTMTGDTGLLLKLIGYGRDRLSQMATSSKTGTTALRSDQAMTGALAALGFTTDGTVRHHTYRRDLQSEIELPVLPEGYRFVEIADDSQLAERVAVHLAVWPEATLDLANYRAVRSSALYRPDLDLVVVAPDGTYAAFLIGWLEPEGGAVQFEPIGARSEFRRLGLTRALVLEGLRRTRELGATVACINCFAENEAGVALYKACGFELPGEWVWWAE